MKKFGKLMVLFGLVFSLSFKDVHANTLNWCGEYLEKDNVGYIKLLRSDVGIGSKKCSVKKYNKRKEDEKTIMIRLKFARINASFANWRKFVGHVVEVRGKYLNGQINKAKLVRDLGR